MTDWISFEVLNWCSGIVVWDLGYGWFGGSGLQGDPLEPQRIPRCG